MASCIWNRVHLFYWSFYLFSFVLFVFVSKNGRSEFKLITMQKTWFEISSVIISSRILEFCFALCARSGKWKGLMVTSMVFYVRTKNKTLFQKSGVNTELATRTTAKLLRERSLTVRCVERMSCIFYVLIMNRSLPLKELISTPVPTRDFWCLN